MSIFKKFYLAKFRGKLRQNLRFENFSLDEALQELLDHIPLNDDGIIEVYKIDFFTDKKTLIKKFVLVSELFLTERKLETLLV